MAEGQPVAITGLAMSLNAINDAIRVGLSLRVSELSTWDSWRECSRRRLVLRDQSLIEPITVFTSEAAEASVALILHWGD